MGRETIRAIEYLKDDLKLYAGNGDDVLVNLPFWVLGSGDELREERNFALEEWGREREVREKERDSVELLVGSLEILGLWVLCVDREREVSIMNMIRRV